MKTNDTNKNTHTHISRNYSTTCKTTNGFSNGCHMDQKLKETPHPSILENRQGHNKWQSNSNIYIYVYICVYVYIYIYAVNMNKADLVCSETPLKGLA